MECKEAGMLVHSYFDSELDPCHASELEAHARGCRSCAEELAGLERLRRLIRDEVPVFRAPPALRERLENEIARRGRRGNLPQPDRRRWLAIAASLAVTVVGSSVITHWMVGAPERQPAGSGIMGDLVSSHLRALAALSPVDVVSTDQHTVKPWFNGRIGVAPPVVDLAERGFPLAGGRIDYVGGRRVAVVVYTRRQHVIDVFALPEEEDTEASGMSGAESLSRDGYTLLRRRWAGLTLWLVSDLNSAELGQFAELAYRRLVSSAAMRPQRQADTSPPPAGCLIFRTFRRVTLRKHSAYDAVLMRLRCPVNLRQLTLGESARDVLLVDCTPNTAY